MKILIISQHIFPMQTPRAHRTTELMKEFTRQGHDVTVYAVLGEYDYSEFQKETGITIKPIPIRWMIHPYNSDGDNKRNFLDKVLSRLFQKVFEFPEIEFRYRIPEILKKDYKHDLLISIAAPHQIHWGVAHYRKNNPNRFPSKWIADCGDPYMMNDKSTNRKSYFEKEERLFCSQADALSVPVESAIEAYYPEYRDKIKVIPQGFKFNFFENNNKIVNNTKTFAYAGTLYKDIRNPSNFLKFLSEQDLDFQFIVYTSHSSLLDEYKSQLGKKLVVKNTMPRVDLLNELSTMDFLVNIENIESPHQVPSKLIDYAIVGRPILSINPTKINNEVIIEFLNGNYSNQLIVLDIEKYKIENVAQLFLNIIRH